HLVDRMDRPARNARLVEPIDPLGAGAAGQIGLQLGVESVAVLEARRRSGVLRPVDQTLRSDRAAEPLPQGPAHGSDVDVAVAGLENARRNAGRMVVARLWRHLAGVQPARGLEIEHEDLRLQERGRYFLTLAGLLALEERH